MKRLFTIFAILLAVGCGPTNDPSDDSPPLENPGVLPDSSNATDAECRNDRNCGNCVFYAGCRSPEFKKVPKDLTTWEAKKSIKNSDNGAPGCVAIIESGNLGHVAYVTKVSHDPHRVWIDEGNYGGPHCGNREGSRAELNIFGYWCP